MATVKDPIKLRQRRRDSGLISLYLDIYVQGQRRSESLKLYLIPENSREDKEKNRETLAMAETIRAQRLIELRNRRYNINDKSIASPNVVAYMRAVMMRKELREATRKIWLSAINSIVNSGNDIPIDKINHYWINSYINHLKRQGLTNNSCNVYLSKLSAMFRQAVKDKLLVHNPMLGINKLKEEETHREYLTIDEVRAMAGAWCKHKDLKRAFLFSCLTGLRYSDIVGLRWRDVRQQGCFTRIVYRQQKTGKQEYLDLSPQAVVYMGERGKNNQPIFTCPINSGAILRRWAAEAGIHKHITFHSGRHTFAVMMLDLGVDIYTVSKMLGHKDIKTTQIYAELLDKRKQDAVLRIPEI